MSGYFSSTSSSQMVNITLKVFVFENSLKKYIRLFLHHHMLSYIDTNIGLSYFIVFLGLYVTNLQNVALCLISEAC